MVEEGRFKAAWKSAQQGAAKAANKLTGAEFRQEFDEFTDAMATVTTGLWNDQQALERRMIALERKLRLAWILLALLSLVAVVLGIALVTLA